MPVAKNPPANAGDIREAGSIPGSRGAPGGGHRNACQYSCLENPMDRGAWQAIVHRVARVRQELATKPPLRLLIRLGKKYTLKAL